MRNVDENAKRQPRRVGLCVDMPLLSLVSSTAFGRRVNMP